MTELETGGVYVMGIALLLGTLAIFWFAVGFLLGWWLM